MTEKTAEGHYGSGTAGPQISITLEENQRTLKPNKAKKMEAKTKQGGCD